MWVFLWFVMAVMVAIFVLWTQTILWQQKKAWATFAAKMGFVYEGGRFDAPPAVTGTFKSRKVAFFTDRRPTDDGRGQRAATAIEVEMGPVMPTAGVLANKEFAALLAPLAMPESYDPSAAGWDKSIIAKTKNRALLAEYLSADRLKTLGGLFAMKNAAAMFLFDEQNAVLRIETVDPVADAERLEKFARKLFAAADILDPSVGAAKAPAASAPSLAEEAPALVQEPDTAAK